MAKRVRRRAARDAAIRAFVRTWSGWKSMWSLVMFDLPTTTKVQRREYTLFRNSLLKLGFVRMQFSVYYRFAPSDEKMAALARSVKEVLPPAGEVRIVLITGKQFEKMLVFLGKKRGPVEGEPQQLELF